MSRGFALLEAMVAVIVTALVIGGMWVWWHRGGNEEDRRSAVEVQAREQMQLAAAARQYLDGLAPAAQPVSERWPLPIDALRQSGALPGGFGARRGLPSGGNTALSPLGQSYRVVAMRNAQFPTLWELTVYADGAPDASLRRRAGIGSDVRDLEAFQEAVALEVDQRAAGRMRAGIVRAGRNVLDVDVSRFDYPVDRVLDGGVLNDPSALVFEGHVALATTESTLQSINTVVVGGSTATQQCQIRFTGNSGAPTCPAGTVATGAVFDSCGTQRITGHPLGVIDVVRVSQYVDQRSSCSGMCEAGTPVEQGGCGPVPVPGSVTDCNAHQDMPISRTAYDNTYPAYDFGTPYVRGGGLLLEVYTSTVSLNGKRIFENPYCGRAALFTGGRTVANGAILRMGPSFGDTWRWPQSYPNNAVMCCSTN